MHQRNEIRSFIRELLHRKGDDTPFTDSESLIVGGRLESIDGVEIVVFLESNFGIDFTKIGFDQTLIDSIDSIMALTERSAAAHH